MVPLRVPLPPIRRMFLPASGHGGVSDSEVRTFVPHRDRRDAAVLALDERRKIDTVSPV